MASELLLPLARATDANGAPYSGATWTFYASGTSTPQAVYADADLNTSLGSTVTADSGGKFVPIYFDASLSYRGVCKNASGSVTLHDIDPINSTTLADLITDLASSTGSSLIGFIQSGAGAVARTAQAKLRDIVSVADFGAIGDGVTDATAAIQAAIDTGKAVYLPRGAYLVDPRVGLVLKNGTTIYGEGLAHSIIAAMPYGGSEAELVGYGDGSIIRRDFNASGANSYVSYVDLHDFAVVMNHPTGAVTTTEIQIGIDLRNVTRSTVSQVWVGNIAPTDQTIYPKVAPTNGYEAQGYGIVAGNVSSGDPEYAGGERNSIVNCNVVGAFKGIVLDDLTLSPLSGAHATTVERCDVQNCHSLLVQESLYTADTTFEGNTLQSIARRPGETDPTFVMRLEGHNGYVDAGYIEAGNDVDYILYLGADSFSNRVTLNHYTSLTGTGYISDAGANNTVEFFASTATPPAVNSLGAPIYLHDNDYRTLYRELWAKFHWNGSAVVIDGSSGNLSVSRNGTGDYTVTFSQNLPSDDYPISITLDTNASNHAGASTIVSHTVSNVRFVTYGQDGGTTTILDPRFVWIRVSA